MTAEIPLFVRVLSVWLAIFPLVTLVMGIVNIFVADSPLVVKAFITTVLVVPVSVLWVVPLLLRGYVWLRATFPRPPE